MVYRVIGIMSGSSLDGLDIAFAEFHETAGKWSFDLKAVACYPYEEEWVDKLHSAHSLNAMDYQLLHTKYGHYIGKKVRQFIADHKIEYQVQLISSHGHTVFHIPHRLTTTQLGDGASIAAETGINVVSDLRAMDVALGGHGAPIVPIGEKLLFTDYEYFLNLGGIANVSYAAGDQYTAFDVCPANRVLNLLAKQEGKTFDESGNMARAGKLDEETLRILNQLEYYHQPYPKSLANSFGTDVVFPLVYGTSEVPDELRTYTEHIALQIRLAVELLQKNFKMESATKRMMVTGGGAHNQFLVERLRDHLSRVNVQAELPELRIIDYKEALIMGLIGYCVGEKRTTYSHL
jgi:anhydro-N-acetylmuramic acid kinase